MLAEAGEAKAVEAEGTHKKELQALAHEQQALAHEQQVDARVARRPPLSRQAARPPPTLPPR